ncbi:MAG: response regulator [Ktedonobacterales bacterium]
MDAFSGKLDGNQLRFSAPAASAETKRDYVLVIDDDPAIVDLLVSFLHEDEGFSVHASPSVRDLLSHTPPEPPGLILLDATLPDEDSDELAPSLRRLPGWHDTPIVLCSGRDTLQELAKEVGAVAHLTKPFSLDEIAELAHQYLPASPHPTESHS